MHYTFPEIRTIDDVLPYIEGRPEFVVAERDFGTVINYAVAMEDTFNMVDADDLDGAIRRELRGIMFDRDGHIMSRPFHKFFNVNEREETQAHQIDLSRPHVIMEKMDGSMIRPILVDGHLRLATKMGVTDVAMQAETWLAAQPVFVTEWLRDRVQDGVTPLFEWVSPVNQIVLSYESADLVYLGTRDNVTGQYVMEVAAPFTTVPLYGSVEGNLSDYVARQRGMEGREGDIIRFADGSMLKVKNDWYVRIHKAIDRVRFDRNIVALIINNEVDDVVSLMPAHEVVRIQEFEHKFWEDFNSTHDRLTSLVEQAKMIGDRKAVATQLIPTLDKVDRQFVFRGLDGHPVWDQMMEYIEKTITTNTKWGQTVEWMEK